MDFNKEVESRQTKTQIIAGVVVAAVLSLVVVIFVTVYFSLPKQRPARLVEIDLKEGETLTYRVDQHIQLHGDGGQEATIRAIVGIRVLNRTSDEYWFLMKSNLSQLGRNASMKGQKIMTDYFLVRLHISSRPSSPTSRKTSESFEVFGPRHIHPELFRQVHSILMQLLPVVQRDRYENVDGEKATGSNSPDPEDSPLLPGSVKMHRQANTLDNENVVVIGNNFNRADFVNLASEIDFDLKYSYSAFINKSNGMITWSNTSFSKQLNFGEPIHYKSGDHDKMMKVAMTSQVSLIEEVTNYFEQAESERVGVRFFVILSLPKAKATFSVNEKPQNITLTPSKNPLVSQTHNSPNSASILPQRFRRSSNFDINNTYILFEKTVVGVKIKGEARYWVKQNVKMGERFVLSFGSYNKTIVDKEYSWNELRNQQRTDDSISWSSNINVGVEVFAFGFGVNFRLTGKLGFSKAYLWPLKKGVQFAVQIKPYAEVTAEIEGYLSAFIIKGGVYGDGTLVRVGLPLTLSLQVSPSVEWCATVSAELTAFELSAGLYYRWCVFSGSCGPRNTIWKSGAWAAIRKNWKLMEHCD